MFAYDTIKANNSGHMGIASYIKHHKFCDIFGGKTDLKKKGYISYMWRIVVSFYKEMVVTSMIKLTKLNFSIQIPFRKFKIFNAKNIQEIFYLPV